MGLANVYRVASFCRPGVVVPGCDGVAVTVDCRPGVVVPGCDGLAVTVNCRTGVMVPGHNGVAVTVDWCCDARPWWCGCNC